MSAQPLVDGQPTDSAHRLRAVPSDSTEATSPMADRVIARITDDLAQRYADTSTRAQVEAIIADARRQIESTSHHPEFVPALVEHYAHDVLATRARAAGGVGVGVPLLVFVCEHNEGRSQMAAAWAEHLGGEHVQVRSAGIHPSGHLNPHVVDVLAERGISLDGAYPSPLHGDVLNAADVVVRLGCSTDQEPGRHVIDWDVRDPHEQPIEVVREVCDDLGARVADLLGSMGVPTDRRAAAGVPVQPVVVSDHARNRWSPTRMLRTLFND
ncbi:protein-tyrosine-phosphatase [Kineosphaera limosa]|uniref:Putative arsenate reductase n=1 Tax=Kineosphaera limosa NBRC 100340 TaxID=1184609 RepID=K6WT89_9MICO|nr:low molecular weight phosphatase family protein [Kineosphaera limosa]NYD99289.1 protein-tyrosine-phosphatase [Kineosphaera limosa]GAB97061.1 putative arsenate reductase [Kineosphaera limosa NBRC 100340]